MIADPLIHTILACLILVLLLVAAISDVRSLTIPNRLVLAVLGLVAVHFAVIPPVIWPGHLLAGGVVFAVTAVMFGLRLIGGGDAKLLAVLGFWVGLADLMTFLLVMTVSGAILGVLGLVLMRGKAAERMCQYHFFSAGWMAALSQGKGVVPYGVAIAVAGFWHVFNGLTG